ncbi:PilW family protein [Aeromonas sp. MR16]|uniref:PilW family protein n=1 Tax=Aeromonas sp. MR16 TaxID=2923420 RepID=UPI001F4A67BB|nr:PilW family protein [Aeromonas sp. MR16]MCH7371460.1 PilW family protein [Aeromonas sp. MR16]
MKAHGFTLIEWLIAMLIGVFLVGGGLSVFVASRATTEDAFDQSELQENGRIAMRLLTQDLKWAGFWGDYTGSPLITASGGVKINTGASLTSSKDCLDERGQGSLPTSSSLAVRPLWVGWVNDTKAITGGAFACIPIASRVARTNIISIKRLIGLSFDISPKPTGTATARAADATSKISGSNRFYLATTTDSAELFKSGDTIGSAITASHLWEYQHFIYYVSGGNIPTLRKRYLTVSDGVTNNDDSLSNCSAPNDCSLAIASGIESLQILLGVDNSLVQDGVIDSYLASQNVTDNEWREGRVVAVRIFILVRSLQPSNSYVNNNVYQVGDRSIPANGDGFRRLLLETSISLRNPAVMGGGS